MKNKHGKIHPPEIFKKIRLEGVLFMLVFMCYEKIYKFHQIFFIKGLDSLRFMLYNIVMYKYKFQAFFHIMRIMWFFLFSK